MALNTDELLKEVTYTATLSSGPGGQHANKASTKVILEWAMNESELFSPQEINRLQNRLRSYLTKDMVLQLSCEETRSQHRNKSIVTKRFIHLVKTNRVPPKKRKKPKPGKKFHQKRLQEKKQQAEKKANRKNPLQ